MNDSVLDWLNSRIWRIQHFWTRFFAWCAKGMKQAAMGTIAILLLGSGIWSVHTGESLSAVIKTALLSSIRGVSGVLLTVEIFVAGGLATGAVFLLKQHRNGKINRIWYYLGGAIAIVAVYQYILRFAGI